MARTIAKDHDDKRGHILTRAAAVFAEHGFARASMSDVARDCGISKANIYHYYDSKNALLFDILDNYLSALNERLLSLPLKTLEPEVQLQRFISEILLAYEGMDNEHKIQAEGIPLLEYSQQEILRGYQREMVRLLSDILMRVAPNAFSGNDRLLRSTVMSLFGMLNWYYMWNSKADSKERSEYAQLIAQLALKGFDGLSEINCIRT